MAGSGLHHHHPHLQYHHHHHWAPPPSSLHHDSHSHSHNHNHNHSQSHMEEVRTIFVFGFPKDVKERELHNLLRWWPGFEASQINFKGDQPMGFALFSSVQWAMQARDALQNLVFDAENNSVLRAEMAKKNLYIKRDFNSPLRGIKECKNFSLSVSDVNSVDPSKRMRIGGDHATANYPGPGTFVSPGAPVWGPQSFLTAPAAAYDPFGGYPVPQVAPVPIPVAPAGYAPVQNMKDNPPCNTLFIGNLGENTSEAELRRLFSGQSGFKQMKLLRQERSTVCFIEFENLKSAVSVHDSLQGAVLSSSDRGGMRIQYSKNPFGRKKDGSVHSGDGAFSGASGTDLNSAPSSSHSHH